jgi:hypothetical protein
MVVSGRLAAALQRAGLTAAVVFAVCMLLAAASAALSIAALLEALFKEDSSLFDKVCLLGISAL